MAKKEYQELEFDVDKFNIAGDVIATDVVATSGGLDDTNPGEVVVF